MHRVGRIPADEVAVREGIPVTSLERTLLDLAAVLSAGELARALAMAERQGGLRRDVLLEVTARYPGRRGVRRLRALLGGETTPALTRSRAEDRLLQMIGRTRLVRPEVNARIGGFDVDFLWRDARVIVDVDGFAFHSSRMSFESDRRRDAQLVGLGYRVMRVTWRQLVREREAFLVRLAQALAAAPH